MDKRKLKNTKSAQVLAYKSAIGFLLLLLSACQSTDLKKIDASNLQATPRPDWIVNLPQSAGFIYGVGSSTIYSSESLAIESANESARLALAKSIRVEVKGSTQVNRISDNGKLSVYFGEAINNSVPEMELAGLTIVERFIEKKSSTVFVLASFNKTEAINQLHQLIDSVDGELAMRDIDLSAAIGSKLSQAIAIKKLLLKRANTNKQLVNLRQQEIFISSTTQALIAKTEQVFNNISFAVLSNQSAVLQSKLIEAITKQGLRVNNLDADFTLQCEVKWHDLNRERLFYSLLSASISLTVGDTVLRTFNQKAKGTSSDQTLARNKAIDKVAEQLSLILAEELMTTFAHTRLIH